jgi:hypothetical protein
LIVVAPACGDDGFNDSPFCRAAREQSQLVEEAIERSRDPESDPKVFEAARQAFIAVRDDAPKEIAPTVNRLADGFTELDQALAAVGYDVSKLTPEQRAQLVDNPELDAATERFRKYVDDEC